MISPSQRPRPSQNVRDAADISKRPPSPPSQGTRDVLPVWETARIFESETRNALPPLDHCFSLGGARYTHPRRSNPVSLTLRADTSGANYANSPSETAFRTGTSVRSRSLWVGACALDVQSTAERDPEKFRRRVDGEAR